MSILGRYVTRIFLGQLMLILFCAVALLQLFDVMSEADGLLADLGGGASVILRYSLLRLPILVSFLLPFSVLIAATLTFGRLHRSSELVAIQALGKPIPGILLLLLPSMLLVAFLHFLINDQLKPPTTRMLAEWEQQAEPAEPHAIALWLRDGENIVSIGRIEEDGRQLEDLVIFRRDAEGNLVEQATAERARHDVTGWQLENIKPLEVRPTTNLAARAIPHQAWETGLDPAIVNDLAALPDALSVHELRRLLEHKDVTSRPLHVYETWLHKSFAIPLSSLFMVVLATASVRGLQRQGGTVLNALIGFGGAFLYFVTDGVLTALGEAGAITPFLAAWIPFLLLALVAGSVLFWVTMPRGRRKAMSLTTKVA